MKTSKTFRAIPPMVGLACLCVLSACQAPLLSPRDERTQFDRYDRVRNEYATQFVEDEYGVKHPNLRARLRPKD